MNQQAAQAALARLGRWRKSSRSEGQTNCVEVNGTILGWVGVRDSKAPHDTILMFRRAAWATFLTNTGR